MVLFVIFLGLFLLAIVYPRSKYLTIAIASFMLFVYTFTWHEGDLEVYEWVYKDLFTGRFYTAYEPGFVALMWLCKKIGLSLYRFIRRQTVYSSFVMALFCIFPFFMFSSVLRSGISCVFVLLAIEQLIIDKGNKKKYLIYVIIGSLFHYSTVLFLPFLLFTGKIKRTRLIGAFVGMCVLTFLINYTNVIYTVVSNFTQRQKIIGWLMKNDATANINGIIAIGILLITVYLLNRNNLKKLSGIGGRYLVSEIRNNQIQISYQMSVYMLFLSPLMVLASPIMRVPYMAFLMFIISTANIAYENREEYIGGHPGTIVMTITWMALVFTIFMWKFYADLPYLKNGAHLFGEFIDAQIMW